MKVIIWHKHGDCTVRLQAYLLASGFEVSVVESVICPIMQEGEVMIVMDGPWIETIPISLRPRCIYNLTFTHSGHMAFRVNQGFRACIARESGALNLWPNEFKIFVPPYVVLPTHDRTKGTGGIAGLIRDQQVHNPEGYAWAQQANVTIIGTDCPSQVDYDVYKTLRWLWHVKTAGYICNAVVKALVCGVPILMNRKTFDLGGYASLLVPDKHVLIRDTPEELKEAALSLPSEKWESMSSACLQFRGLFCHVQPADVLLLRELVKKVGGV